MTDREVMQQTLEALQYGKTHKAITILREALEQPEQQAAPQRAWAGLTEKDWEYVKDKKGTSLDSFDQGAAWAADQLMRRNT